MLKLGLLIDKYQRVFRTDGKWIKRRKYPLEIPLRDHLDEKYQEVYYKKDQHKEWTVFPPEITMGLCNY